jgi:hypothetical protein
MRVGRGAGKEDMRVVRGRRIERRKIGTEEDEEHRVSTERWRKNRKWRIG